MTAPARGASAPTRPVRRGLAPVGDAWAHLEWRALGTRLTATVVAGDGDTAAALAERAPDIVERLESRWSRFRPESELSRLNRAAGTPVVVSDDTFGAVAHAVEAWRMTGGAFDPTVLPSLLALGYDRDFRALEHDDTVATAAPADRHAAEEERLGAGPAPGCSGIVLDPLVRSVHLPPGAALDLGGIGKGLAADRVVQELVDAGATGVDVDFGGDVRVAGRGPIDGAWPVDVDDPLATGRTGALRVRDGGIATSTHLRRWWTRDGQRFHHLVDPRTGEPATSVLASVTVVAATTAWAEVLAKAAYVLGPGRGATLVADAGATGLLVGRDGRVIELAGLTELRP